MENKPVILVLGTRCPPGVEQKFSQWYEEVHIPMMSKFKGMSRVTRYKVLNGTGQNPMYLTIYQFINRQAYEEFEKSPERAAARKEMERKWKEGEDYQTLWRVAFEALKTWEK